MTNEQPEPSRSVLSEFFVAAQKVRASYETNGPSRVDENLFLPIKAFFPLLSNTIDNEELLNAIETVQRLCYRCVHHSEGLCFVTGEYGLVPRIDLIDQFDHALEFIAHHLDGKSNL